MTGSGWKIFIARKIGKKCNIKKQQYIEITKI